MTETDGKRNVTHVVLLLHGIESEGEWMQKLEAAFDDDSIRIVPVKVGRVSVTQFLSPFDHSGKEVGLVLGRYLETLQTFGGARVSVIAHSYGTYVLTQMLLEYPTIKLSRIVLCGSVVKQQFKWSRIANQIGDGLDKAQFIVNECGHEDRLPILARTFGFRYGNSGTHGFGNGLVTDRFHKGSHGLFFTDAFIAEYWKPFIEGDSSYKIPRGKGKQGEGIPRLVNWLARWPRLSKLIAYSLLIGILWVVFVVIRMIGWAPPYNGVTLADFHVRAMKCYSIQSRELKIGKPASDDNSGSKGKVIQEYHLLPDKLRTLNDAFEGDVVHWTGEVIEVAPTDNAYRIVHSKDARGPAKIWAEFSPEDYDPSFTVGNTKEFTGRVKQVNELSTIVEQCNTGDHTCWWSRLWFR